jgi:uncharacterized membrane protein
MVYSKAKLLGHPIHPMLVAFPVAFYTGTLAAFIAYAASQDPFWGRLANIVNWAGVVTAGVAAIPGLIDWAMGIPRQSAAKRTGLTHMVLNVSALLVFFVCAIAYSGHDLPPASTGIVLSAVGVALTLPAGFFGWKLVQDHHVGIRLSPAQERLEPAQSQPSDRHHQPPHGSYAGE